MGGIRQIRGIVAISAALDAGEHLGLVLVQDDAGDAAIERLVCAARRHGIPIRRASAAVLRRMTSVAAPTPILALSGRSPGASFEEVLEQGGAIWLLLGVSYATNAGVAIRTAEGAGADAIVVDAPDFDHADRRSATRTSMRADWYMPVFWQEAEETIARARSAGHRILAVENTGRLAPWDLDLTAPSLFIVGGESRGIPDGLAQRADEIIRIPMGGFIPSFNLQIAVGVVAIERLRQLGPPPAPVLPVRP